MFAWLDIGVELLRIEPYRHTHTHTITRPPIYYSLLLCLIRELFDPFCVGVHILARLVIVGSVGWFSISSSTPINHQPHFPYGQVFQVFRRCGYLLLLVAII